MLQKSIFPVEFGAVLCKNSTSCGGMSNEIVLRSTFTKESVHGKMKKIPVDKKGMKDQLYYIHYYHHQS